MDTLENELIYYIDNNINILQKLKENSNRMNETQKKEFTKVLKNCFNNILEV